ncbi:MAG TPA: hypothetical protein VHD83_18985 [Puia sp.]|nr:hypothetical protein [Puia sp.]
MTEGSGIGQLEKSFFTNLVSYWLSDISLARVIGLASELGVSPERIDTIIDFAAAEKYKVKTDGNGYIT